MRRALLGVLLLAGCGGGPTEHDDPTARARRATLQGVVAEVDPRFLSIAVDSSQLVGGLFWSPDPTMQGALGSNPVDPYDFARPRLRALAAALGPSMLRLGGSEADVLYYDLAETPGPVPEGYDRSLTREQWLGAMDFAEALGWDVFFTLNAGPSARNATGAWVPDNAQTLVRFATERDDPVVVWELGNEINAFVALHGLEHQVSGSTYAADLAAAKAMLQAEGAAGLLAGPSSAYWPEVGEAFPVYEDTLAADDGALDLVTWHYYPQQSTRCPLASRAADPALMRDPSALDEVGVWAAEVERIRDAHAPGLPVWLGETGNAQCGGAPGISDTFLGSLWWADQLGQLAARGQPVVVRQNLSGADYALLSEPDLEPRPDYWLSVLWARRMGTTVLGAVGGADRSVRTYAHCAADGPPGAIVVLSINLDAEVGAFVSLETDLDLDLAKVRVDRLTPTDAEGRAVAHNGATLVAGADGTLPVLDPVEERLDPAAPRLYLPASAISFFTFEDASHPDCR